MSKVVIRTDDVDGFFARAKDAARRADRGQAFEGKVTLAFEDPQRMFAVLSEARRRLMLEVMDAVVGEVGAGRTGVRLSPVTPANDLGQDSDAQALYGHVVEKLAPMKLAYLHLIEGATGGPRDAVPFDFEALRRVFKAANPAGAWMVNNGYDRTMAIAAVEQGRADLVAFGKPFISNPDLVRRLRENAALNEPKRETFYGGGAAGYTDYPVLA